MKTQAVQYGEKRAFRNIIIALFISAIALLFMNSGILFAENGYTQKIVTTTSGLNLRTSPDAKSSIKGVIKHGETVEVIETTAEEVTIAGKKGHWVRVKWRNLNGWAFDAFLADVPDSPLLDRFVAIAVEITGGADCTFSKSAGRDRMAGSCGGGEASIDPVDKPARVKGNLVIFEYILSECTDWNEDDEYEPSCAASRTEYYECAIDGAKILATKEGNTLKTDVSCIKIKTEIH